MIWNGGSTFGCSLRYSLFIVILVLCDGKSVYDNMREKEKSETSVYDDMS